MDSDAQNALIIIIVIAFYFIIFGVPIMKILNKAGYSRAWIFILLVPFVNLVMLWVFAFARWPNLAGSQQAHAYGAPGYPPPQYPPQYQPQGYQQQPGYQQPPYQPPPR
jgi:hypothetical protein